MSVLTMDGYELERESLVEYSGWIPELEALPCTERRNAMPPYLLEVDAQTFLDSMYG